MGPKVPLVRSHRCAWDLAGNGKAHIAELVNGKVTSGPDLSVDVNGMKMPNPFVIGSGPPGTNYQVMKKAFDEGWGGVICKTLSLDSSKVRPHPAQRCRTWHCPAMCHTHTWPPAACKV